MKCEYCNKEYKPGDKPDPCLGRLPGINYACCGHGKDDGYIVTKILDKELFVPYCNRMVGSISVTNNLSCTDDVFDAINETVISMCIIDKINNNKFDFDTYKYVHDKNICHVNIKTSKERFIKFINDIKNIEIENIKPDDIVIYTLCYFDEMFKV